MRKLLFVFMIYALPPAGPALAQQPQGSSPQMSEVGDDVRLMCRNAALKLCDPGYPPDRAAFRHCVEEKREKLPLQCLALFAQSGPPPR
ncbi:hypothetical protein SAMN05444158_3052 [Bradyrhizobium canariense]|uniref:Cysteine rich repeat-containing protein n=1 Tax=Bradyrhizobium canariense TaxID=255045 RepID=A0A1H1UPY8_9BRAD|nr:hypothetical protein SAMN05444158_3052 [Bradyrhizobium canariense]